MIALQVFAKVSAFVQVTKPSLLSENAHLSSQCDAILCQWVSEPDLFADLGRQTMSALVPGDTYRGASNRL